MFLIWILKILNLKTQFRQKYLYKIKKIQKQIKLKLFKTESENFF